MINYNQPSVQLLPNPTGIDFEIQKMQEKLAGLPWLQYAFGRCTKQSEFVDTGGNRKRDTVIIYPEVYKDREPMNVMANDNLTSYCFFHALDPLSTPQFTHFELSLPAVQPLSIIFWMNLQKIDDTRNYNFIEELRRQVFDIIKSASSFKPVQSFLEYDQVFKPFTITEFFRQYLKPPYAGFKITGNLYYDYAIC